MAPLSTSYSVSQPATTKPPPQDSSNEASPLLESQKPEVQHAPATPVPKAQLASLCIVRLVEPIAFTQIFPYINEMMLEMHVTDDPSRVGFYSGMVESAFAVAQLFSIYQWARLSDAIGRRPVIFLGVIGMTLASALFGLSNSFVGVLLVRCIAGLFSGNIAVVQSVLGELTDSSNQAIAYPIFGLTWPLGSIIGPLIGGSFSNPATNFPDLFDTYFFRTYPYFLPGCIAALVSIIGMIFGYIFLEETLPSKRRHVEGTSTYDTLKIDIKPPCIRALLSIPLIYALSLSGFALSFIGTAFDVLFVLFCYSPIESGGLAFSATEIGLCLAGAGIISILIQLFVTPWLLARCDHVRVYNACMGLWAYCFALLPLLNVVARLGGGGLTLAEADVRVQALVWCGLAVVLGLSKLGCLAFAISMILVKDAAPGPESLGATNGLVQFAMCFARAFSPAFVSSLFALSLEASVFGGYLWVVVMVSISFLSTLLGSKIERGRSASIAACDSGLSIVIH
ncbi:MFS general substrate transporter [Artomyces pyxidatus]|uniref:MFS general substrate transporter n=1 Tax=Artomyces pyxidatus TaxID=48021 RepID=A0ACB8T455_9AGAM|nr:MFS general substrate transporter [Artomyces pyxidatus]